jgi:uncharacterized SAM-dependent methyltransferase
MNGLFGTGCLFRHENVELIIAAVESSFRQAEKERTTRPLFVFTADSLTSHTQRNKEHMLSAVTIRAILRVGRIFILLLPLTGRKIVCEWKSIW